VKTQLIASFMAAMTIAGLVMEAPAKLPVRRRVEGQSMFQGSP
jgi:hypothetical protein